MFSSRKLTINNIYGLHKISRTYIHIHINETVKQVRDQSIAKWQNQWDRSTKGLTSKQFFPIIKDRLTNKIKLTPNFTAVVRAHGKNKGITALLQNNSLQNALVGTGTKQWITYYMAPPNYRGKVINLKTTYQTKTSGR